MNFLRTSIFLYLLGVNIITSAQVWPGDVNNNGVTNNIDLLWYGSVYNDIGPPREVDQQGTQWENKTLIDLWSDDFPNGVNHAFADCDGDGKVEFEDAFPIILNYNKTHDVITPDIFTQGTEGTDPPLFFISNTSPSQIIEGNPVVLSVNLGTDILPIEEFSGIAFTIRYDPTLFSPNFGGGSFSLDNNSWIGSDIETVDFDIKDPINGRVEVGITRKNIGNISGFGPIGYFFIVIEDHVVGFQEPSIETQLWLEDVKLLNDSLSETIVFADTIDITILNDEIINSTQNEEINHIKVFPNPTSNNLLIQSKNHSIDQVELLNSTGNSMRNYYDQTKTNESIELIFHSIPKGIYFLKIATKDKSFIQKITICD